MVDVSQVAAGAGMDQLSAKAYLQDQVFPKLESALNTVSYHFLLNPIV